MTKWWLKSKTILLNVLAALLALLVALEPSLPMLQAALPPERYAWVAFGVSVLTIILRFVTTKPVRAVRKPKIKIGSPIDNGD